MAWTVTMWLIVLFKLVIWIQVAFVLQTPVEHSPLGGDGVIFTSYNCSHNGKQVGFHERIPEVLLNPTIFTWHGEAIYYLYKRK